MSEEELKICVAEMRNDLKWIMKEIEEFKLSAEKKYAPKMRYIIVERLVYGMTGLVLMAFGSAIVAGVIKAAEYTISKI